MILNKKGFAYMCSTYGTKYSRMDQVKFSKGCLPQIIHGPFLNTFSHMYVLLVVLPETSTRVLPKKIFLKILQNPLESTCNFFKRETLAQMFSCKLCKFLRPSFLQNTSGGCSCSLIISFFRRLFRDLFTFLKIFL